MWNPVASSSAVTKSPRSTYRRCTYPTVRFCNQSPWLIKICGYLIKVISSRGKETWKRVSTGVTNRFAAPSSQYWLRVLSSNFIMLLRLKTRIHFCTYKSNIHSMRFRWMKKDLKYWLKSEGGLAGVTVTLACIWPSLWPTLRRLTAGLSWSDPSLLIFQSVLVPRREVCVLPFKVLHIWA